MTDYIALIHKDADSDYGVSFPDLPGCISAGVDLDDARRMGAEALALHIEGLVDDGDAVPAPSTLEAIMREAANRDAVAVMIPVDLRAKAVRINITVPEDALRDIDRFAEAHGQTRSGFLVAAARRAMEAV